MHMCKILYSLRKGGGGEVMQLSLFVCVPVCHTQKINIGSGSYFYTTHLWGSAYDLVLIKDGADPDCKSRTCQSGAGFTKGLSTDLDFKV